MNAIIMKHFDTVAYIKKLREVEFTQAQSETLAQEAEHLVEAIWEQQHSVNKELATKGDVLATKRDLNSELKQTELRLQKEIEIVRKEIMAAKNQTLLLMGTFGVFLLGVMAKGFHWL